MADLPHATVTPTRNGDRDSLGRYRPGNNGPRGRSRDWMTDFRRYCKGKDITTGDQAVLLIEAVVDRAYEGDMGAAKLLLDRIYGPVPKEPVNVNVDNRQVHVQASDAGPRNLSAFIGKLNEVARNAGLLDGDDDTGGA